MKMNLKALILISVFALADTFVNAACSNAFGQCGGSNYRGENCCVSGYYCKYYNEWFSQCIPGNTTTTSRVRTVGTQPTAVVQQPQQPAQPQQPTQPQIPTQPQMPTQPQQPAANIAIHIAGDSTCDGTTANQGQTVGWGKFVSNYVTCPVNNHAKAGRSARSFWREGRWTTLINGVKPGDYVFIQFGHNDGGGPNHEKERGCVDGTGDETVTVRLSSGETEVVHTFPWYLRQMVKQVFDKQANPILLTQTPRKIFTNGKIEAPGRFHDYTIMVAKELNIPCLNMNQYIARQLESLGEQYLDNNKWFPVDYLHPSPVAADFIAKILVNTFHNCEPIEGLINVLNDKGREVKYDCRK